MFSNLKVAMHAGQCCGIKTIYHMGDDPTDMVYEKSATDKSELERDRNGGPFHTDFDFFWEAAPKQTAGERFDRILTYIERVRHFGLVEVALAVRTEHCNPVMHGETVSMLERGELTSFEEGVTHALDSYDEEWDECDYEEAGGSSWSLQDAWIPFLEERGFREVSRFPNINSGNEVAVFHLVMNGEYYKAKKEKK